MAKSLLDIVKNNISEYYAEENGKLNKLLSYLTDRLFVTSLIETAKIGYPYEWLTVEQREFLESSGEKWLADYLNLPYPLYRKNEGFSELPLAYISSEINKIKEKLGLEDVDFANSVIVDRIFRFKIRPEVQRNFYNVFYPVFVLYGLKKGDYFKKMNKKDRQMFGKVASLFVNRFFIEVVKKDKKSLDSMGVTKELLNDIERILIDSGYGYLSSKIVALRKKISESFVDREDKTVSEEENLLSEAISIIKKAYYPYHSKLFKERVGFDLTIFTFKLRKKHISKKEYENLLSKIEKIESIEEISEAGKIFRKVLESKEIKDKSVKKIDTFSVQLDDSQRKQVDKVLKYMSKNKLIDISSLSGEDIERLRKALYSVLKTANEDEISKYSEIRLIY